MTQNFVIRKVAVLGAGVMGAQIAAHLVNANVETLLFDLPAPKNGKGEGDPAPSPNSPPQAGERDAGSLRKASLNGIVNKALDGLKKLEPSPLASPSRLAFISAANYGQHLDKLRDCDLVIEAIAERIDWKSDLYKKVAPYRRRACDLCDQHLRPVDQQARIGVPGKPAPPFLRHPLLQSAALHAPGRADPVHRHRYLAARPARGIPRLHAGQGRGAREGHAQLHREPHRRVFDAGHQAPRAGVQPRLRHRGCADRALSRPSRRARRSARWTWSASTCSRTWSTPCART